jgi:hypothetical protein
MMEEEISEALLLALRKPHQAARENQHDVNPHHQVGQLTHSC